LFIDLPSFPLTFITVTANAREEEIRNTLDAGIDVVSKPFRVQELLPKIKSLIQRTQEASEGGGCGQQARRHGCNAKRRYEVDWDAVTNAPQMIRK
jgi:DNA-binding response OmpR family regulator